MSMSKSPPSTGSSCTTESREGAGYFVGYERESNRRVGFIGLSGFQSQSPCRPTSGFPCEPS